MSAPRLSKHEVAVPAVAIAADADTPITEAPFAGTVTAVTYHADAAITGANTNSRTVTLYNRGQAGAGTTVVATLAFTSGVNAAQFAGKVIPLSVVAGATTVAAGDILEWNSLHVGTGIVDPGGLVHCEVTRGNVASP
jgi:hypothetical protein